MQIRDAMNESKQRVLLTGIVEADETYIGGKPRKGAPGEKPKRGRGTKKTPVVGMVERGGRVVAKVVKKKDLSAKRLAALVRKNVDTFNATLITDEFGGYVGIAQFMRHETVNHQVWYVDGYRHTNTIEGLLGRMVLLPWPGFVIGQNAVDDPDERIELRPHRRLAAPVARRHRERQHL